MRLEKHFNPRIVFLILYFSLFLVFVLYGIKPVEATEAYSVDNVLYIPSIGLNADVTNIRVEDGELKTPTTIVGSYSRNNNKTLLIGHSTGVFHDLDNVKIGDVIKYGDIEYTVSKYIYTTKSAINMNDLLAPEKKDTIVLMTCAGTLLHNSDATHRIILIANNTN